MGGGCPGLGVSGVLAAIRADLVSSVSTLHRAGVLVPASVEDFQKTETQITDIQGEQCSMGVGLAR